MGTTLRYLGQGAVYSVFALTIWYFSVAPVYTHLEPGEAMIKFSFAHAAKPKGECHRLTSAELQELAPNMRRPVICPRQRVDTYVELDLNGKNIYQASLSPTGLAGDGSARMYKRIPVAAGTHKIAMRLRDTLRKSGFDYQASREITLKAGQNFTIDFKAPKGGFLFE